MIFAKGDKYKIFKFDVILVKRGVDSQLVNRRRMARCQEWHKFELQFLDKFCREKNHDLQRYTLLAKHLGMQQETYRRKDGTENPTLFHAHEIAWDMLQEDSGVKLLRVWDYHYVAIPLEQHEMIDFFEQNAPSWRSTVKQI